MTLRRLLVYPVASGNSRYSGAGLRICQHRNSWGYPEAGTAATICFEWLQRPENVLAGFIRWTDYRGREAPLRSASSTTRQARWCSIRLRRRGGRKW